MPDAAEPVMEDPKADRCPRCLQTVPPRASRCPGCGQPIHSMRPLIFAIGIAGALALVFVMLVMYRLARNEDAANAPVPVDQNAAQQPLFPDSPPESSSEEPAKLDKNAPLEEH